MKINKFLSFIIIFILICSVFCLSAFASDVETVSQSVSEPTTNIYYIIKGMWRYFLPADVIADNSEVIAFYTITFTVLFALAPLFFLYKMIFRKK